MEQLVSRGRVWGRDGVNTTLKYTNTNTIVSWKYSGKVIKTFHGNRFFGALAQ